MTALPLSLGALFLAASTALPAGSTVTQDPPIPADTEIQTTESGLKYSILQPGDGVNRPGAYDKVMVHYTGWLTDGTKFDSSRDRRTPANFGVSQVIAGWTEGLQLMSVGAKYKLTIPWNLAYGEAGRPPKIPAKSDLIFEVELLEIVARTFPYVAWDESKESVKLDNGLEYQVLSAGEGEVAKDASLVTFEYAIYNGEEVLSSSAQQAPISGKPDRLPLPLFSEAAKVMKVGDHFLLRVPKAMGLAARRPPEMDPDAPGIWQLKLTKAMTFDTPEFMLPDDSELTTTESGLQYKMLREGTGKAPTVSSRVSVHYSGWLTDGTGFDSSYERGEPATFGVTQVISGWTEGLQLMREGGKILLKIPSNLGYGDRGSPPKIPGGATLVFIVELISV